MQYVFIVGIARTGSKIYMSTLNKHSDIDIVSELHYLAPRYIRRDAITTLKLRTKPRKPREWVQSALDKMYSGSVLGDFWEQSKPSSEIQHRIADLDPDPLRERLLQSDINPKSLLQILLDEHAKVAGKRRAGAKFPVDISKVSTLMKWFPDARYVHLIRDPRAVYTSMTIRDVPGAKEPGLARLYAMARRLPYAIIQYKNAMALHQRCRLLPNYYLARFEDTLAAPSIYIKRLCDFLNIDYSDSMLVTERVDSSYSGDRSNGIDATAADNWQKCILPFEQRAVEFALSKEMKLLGYTVQHRHT